VADKQIKIGIGDMKLARQEGTLITYALGSCIGITLYDPNIKLGALIHIMLPNATGANAGNVFKFADTGIRETLRKLAAFGGVKSRYVCKIAGGAQMFEMTGGGSIGNIGQRNIDSVKRTLQAEGIRIKNQDVGANYARTMLLDVSTGKVAIRTIGKPEITL
jgi:chemotaxis protein CheD